MVPGHHVAADAQTQIRFEDLERGGFIVQTGEYHTAEDGAEYPVYVEVPSEFLLVAKRMKALERDGLIVKTGEYHKDERRGLIGPAYTLTDLGRKQLDSEWRKQF
jgi:hypothetical protein